MHFPPFLASCQWMMALRLGSDMLPYIIYTCLSGTKMDNDGKTSAKETRLMGGKEVWIGQAPEGGIVIVPGSHRPEQNQRDELKKSSDNMLVLATGVRGKRLPSTKGYSSYNENPSDTIDH